MFINQLTAEDMPTPDVLRSYLRVRKRVKCKYCTEEMEYYDFKGLNDVFCYYCGNRLRVKG